MAQIAIIGGTGLTSLQGLEITDKRAMLTRYGEPSAEISYGRLGEQAILFLPRHGYQHSIPPHKVNYRANIAALKEAGAEQIIAVNAVGGITKEMQSGKLVIPDQIIDYTWSRKQTFFEDEDEDDDVVHIDFTWPYCESLRKTICDTANSNGIAIIDYGVYGATQGPRLESIAEIARLERDGCHIVGMTGMPEAALARELELCYACISVVANMAAGKGDGEITMAEIEANLVGGMEQVRQLLSVLIPVL